VTILIWAPDQNNSGDGDPPHSNAKTSRASLRTGFTLNKPSGQTGPVDRVSNLFFIGQV
jgi:hypothetical protein